MASLRNPVGGGRGVVASKSRAPSNPRPKGQGASLKS